MIVDVVLRDLLKEFFANKIIEVNIDKGNKTSTGNESPLIMNHRKIFSIPTLRQKVIHKWASLIQKELKSYPESNFIIAGSAMTGVVPAYALAEVLNCGYIYIRSTQEVKLSALSEINKCRIEGLWYPGMQVVVVDDLITSGDCMLSAVETIRNEGGNILFGTSITRHDFRSTIKKFEVANVNCLSMYRTSDIFDTAYGISLMGSKEMRAIMQWLNDLDVKLM